MSAEQLTPEAIDKVEKLLRLALVERLIACPDPATQHPKEG